MSHTATLKSDCRFCGSALEMTFADLGMSPLANSFVPMACSHAMERFYPLHAYVCTTCWLVQLQVFESSEAIFSNYAYFSSYSKSWLEHASHYVDQMRERFALDGSTLVVEIASNDGYLLQYFRRAEVPVLGVEPARNVAEVAKARGIPTVVEFFGTETARRLAAEGCRANLLLGNNVLGHVPEVNDFVAGMKLLLKPAGVITMEFPHLQRLVEECQFDTIYHEHFSYFSFCAVERIFARQGLTLFDVEELPTHGGSLRIYARHKDFEGYPVSPRVGALRSREQVLGYEDRSLYAGFAERVKAVKRDLLDFLITQKRQGRSIVGYGAPAKGNTLLNYCGVSTDMIDYTVDLNPRKQNHLLPGTRIPVFSPDHIAETKPDYVLILPWNLRDEIMTQMGHIREWGGRFVLATPEVRVL